MVARRVPPKPPSPGCVVCLMCRQEISADKPACTSVTSCNAMSIRRDRLHRAWDENAATPAKSEDHVA